MGSFNLKVIWPNLVRSEILDLGTLDLETAVPMVALYRKNRTSGLEREMCCRREVNNK